jgi:hypothetical protein
MAAAFRALWCPGCARPAYTSRTSRSSALPTPGFSLDRSPHGIFVQILNLVAILGASRPVSAMSGPRSPPGRLQPALRREEALVPPLPSRPPRIPTTPHRLARRRQGAHVDARGRQHPRSAPPLGGARRRQCGRAFVCVVLDSLCEARAMHPRVVNAVGPGGRALRYTDRPPSAVLSLSSAGRLTLPLPSPPLFRVSCGAALQYRSVVLYQIFGHIR